MTPDIMSVAIEAAQEAGHLLLSGYGRTGEIESKRDASLVTEYDKESERLITSKIRAAFPSHAILAEEGTTGGAGTDYCWVIDPLDGTHNFIRQVSAFGVSIGVMRGDEFFIGVINIPREREFYAAQKGQGAFCNEKPIRVSDVRDLAKCSLCFDSAVRSAPQVIPVTLSDLGTRVFNLRVYGSSVRVLTYIADGRADASIEFDDAPWDFAAGIALIQEAGGVVTAMDGSPMTLAKRGYVSSNGHLHPQMLDRVAAVKASAGGAGAR